MERSVLAHVFAPKTEALNREVRDSGKSSEDAHPGTWAPRTTGKGEGRVSLHAFVSPSLPQEKLTYVNSSGKCKVLRQILLRDCGTIYLQVTLSRLSFSKIPDLHRFKGVRSN